VGYDGKKKTCSHQKHYDQAALESAKRTRETATRRTGIARSKNLPEHLGRRALPIPDLHALIAERKEKEAPLRKEKTDGGRRIEVRR